jgi:hypothetical protein
MNVVALQRRPGPGDKEKSLSLIGIETLKMAVFGDVPPWSW